MNKRYLTVFIIMVAMVFLAGNVYADNDDEKGWKRYKKADRHDRTVQRLEYRIAKLEEKLVTAKQKYAELTGDTVTEPEPVTQATEPVECKPAPVAEFSCIGCDFSNSTITDRNFSYADLSASTFLKVTLRGVNFTGAILDGVNMLDADLRGVDLSVAASVDGILWYKADEELFNGAIIPGGSAICPDGTHAVNNVGGTCEGHLTP